MVNWEKINYPSEKDDYKNFRKIILTIALNVLYAKSGKIYSSYSFNDSKRKRMALSFSKKSIGVINKKALKHKGNFYCLNVLHSFRAKKQTRIILKSM